MRKNRESIEIFYVEKNRGPLENSNLPHKSGVSNLPRHTIPLLLYYYTVTAVLVG